PERAENGELYQRRRAGGSPLPQDPPAPRDGAAPAASSSWRRIALLILALRGLRAAAHCVSPALSEGLAVGVGFGAIGKSESATFQSARNLAIGIGIQNFPEGLAVSLPLRGAGFSTWKAFWYGQLSGMVEPLAGVLGAFAVVLAQPLLPYALGFAAGAMVYVVMDDIIPEAQSSGHGKLASWSCILGFVVMMSLDVGLG
ncbi:S39AB protein, partial [Erithacus rubecula]|nr:S39AB protein [Erithacus rubecula]